jgi:transposase, IS6 family
LLGDCWSESGRNPAPPLSASAVQYLNNILEQDHRAIKRRVKAKQSFREFRAAQRTIAGYEAIHMIRKGQARWVSHDDVRQQNQFIDRLFDLAA